MKLNHKVKRTSALCLAFGLALLALCLFLSCQAIGSAAPKDTFSVHWESTQFQIGEVDLQLDPIAGLGKITKVSVPVFYFPKEDAVVLRFRPEYTTYQQCWSNNGRHGFIEALEKYNNDYEERNLDIKDRKSKGRYGIVRGYLIWQQMAFTVRARGNMNVELGYTFKDGAPYFLINQLEAEYVDLISRDNDRTSIVIPMYLTRKQAADLAAMFDQSFLDGLSMPTGVKPGVKSGDSDKDNY